MNWVQLLAESWTLIRKILWALFAMAFLYDITYWIEISYPPSKSWSVNDLPELGKVRRSTQNIGFWSVDEIR